MQHKTKIILLAGVLGAVTLTAMLSVTMPAFARMGQAAGGHGFDFAQADANSDGQLTREELNAWGDAQFAAQDADGDGALSREELAAHILERMRARADEMAERMLERVDANDDGKLALEEIEAGDRIGRMFDRLDGDDDGAISLAEFEDGAKRRHGRGFGHHGKPSE